LAPFLGFSESKFSFNSILSKKPYRPFGFRKTVENWNWNWETVPNQFKVGTRSEKQFQVPSYGGTGSETRSSVRSKSEVELKTCSKLELPTHARTEIRDDPACFMTVDGAELTDWTVHFDWTTLTGPSTLTIWFTFDFDLRISG